jgi:outer membrane protein
MSVRIGLAKRLMMAAAMSAGLLAAAPQAWAETLNDALAKAYLENPALRAERARQRSTDELVPQALSGWRPTINAQAQITNQRTDVKSFTQPFTNPNTGAVTPGSSQVDGEVDRSEDIAIQLNQPIFRGFRTVNGVKQAEANVEAGRQDLLVQELTILFRTVQAYMNVVRDRQILSLRQQNVTFLREQLRAANERFTVGEITRTDVAQARSSLAQAQGFVASARNNLDSSIANYVRLVGRKPSNLKYPRIARLPGSLDAAQNVATEINPNILSAAYNEIAANYNIDVIRGQLLPEINLQATASRTELHGSRQFSGGASQDWQTSASVAGVLTVPLYEGGQIYSSVRQAKQLASQRRLLVIETGRGVREGVSIAWANYLASTQLISANRTQVEAARLALEGVQQEYLVGSRTTLDVLNAQQVLVTARISLVQAQADQIVASYDVLASIGKLTARNLKLKVPYYDPEANYRDVRNKWIGLKANTVE